MTGPKQIAQRQLDLGPAGWFRPEATTPPANQIRVKAGIVFSGGRSVLAPADQLTVGFAAGGGQQRYDLVYIDSVGATQVLAGDLYAIGSAPFSGAPGWTGVNPGTKTLPDNCIPVAYVLVDEPVTVIVAASDITEIVGHIHIGRRYDGYYIDKGLYGAAPTGSSDVVTAMFAGESQLGSASIPYTLGVITTGAFNFVHLLDQKGAQIEHKTGTLVYGRVTYLAGVWTLSYYYKNAVGVETAVTAIETDTTLGVGGLTNVQLAGVAKVFANGDAARPMFASSVTGIADEFVGVPVGTVPLGGMIEWQPPTSVPVLPFGFEYADGTAVTTPGSPYLPANMPGFLKPIRMKTAAGGAQRFGRGADYSAGSHGAAFAEPVGGVDTIPNASPGTDTQGGVTPFSGTITATTSTTSVAHTHAITTPDTSDRVDDGAYGSTALYGLAANLVGATHAHHHTIAGSTSAGMSGSDPHSHNLVAAPFSGSINTAHAHTVNAHNHGGENRPAFQDVAVIMRVL